MADAPVAPAYSAADFGHALQRLLPSGRAWPRDPVAVQSQVCAALGIGLERLNARANALLVDAFPPSAVGLLPEWEAALGLPDPCAGPQPTIALRQQSVAAAMAAQGGQSVPYFAGVAAALGFPIKVQEFAPSRFGQPFGLPFGGAAWAYTWRVTVNALTIQRFEFGAGRFGDAFRSWGSPVLECTLGRIGPAHAVLQFAYIGPAGPAPLGAFILGRNSLG